MNRTLALGCGAALAAVLFLGWATAAFAYIEGDGKGKPERDCYIGLEGYSSSDLTPYGKKGKPAIQCTDCDPSCDLDGDTTPNGSCTFSFAVRVNDTGDPQCTPIPLKKVIVKAKTKGTKLLSKNGDFCTIPLDGSSATSCFVNLPVLVRKFGKSNPKPGKGKLSMKATKPADKDKFTFICNPRPAGEACPRCPARGPGDPTKVLFTNSLGTLMCGGAKRIGDQGVWTDGNPPFSGQLLDENDMVLGNLGLGCLFLGGGAAFNVPPGANPDNATSTFAVAGVCDDGTLDLKPDAGTSSRDCTLGPLSTSSCIDTLPPSQSCTQDSDCAGGGTGSCAQDAACYFGTPLPIANAGLSTCVINVILDGAGGTVDPATGDASMEMPLQSRVYLTGNGAEPCPTCVGGICDPGWMTASPAMQSPNAGDACTTTAAAGVTHDCLPAGTFVGRIPVNLTPLTTASTMLDSPEAACVKSPMTQCTTSSDCPTVCSGTPNQTCTTSNDCPVGQTCGSDTCAGKFCPGQLPSVGPGLYGAFGLVASRKIVETGQAFGDLSGGSGTGTLASTFCIPATGNGLIDGSADLPGPGATSLPGTLELVVPAP